MAEPHLTVKNLVMYYRTVRGEVKAVDNVSFSLPRSKTVAIIGESGCGKSSLAKSIIKLLPRNVSVYKGVILFDGVDLMKMDEESFRRDIRWVKITYVPQAALNSLNPVIKIGEQMIEPLLLHFKMRKTEALERAAKALKTVGISEEFINHYPFELSGGMRQRVIIAMSMLTNPELMVLDEPTSSLDVLTQANIINLLKTIKRDLKLSMIFITHDVGLSSELADRVAVMYAGQIVEFASADEFYRNPKHPYSQKLMDSVPTLKTDKKLDFIPGSPPSLLNPPRGCRFAERCPYRFEKCKEPPPVINLSEEFYVRCWLYEKR
ncbi:MAG: peptide ABC transporter ATPase [Candidatus Bathyarchaeota archaeon B24]|nr:MAG: peptide ABC transporter ATPase [Candidatus Bathyarchaeota archaeon B24]RLI23566.1 MAG: ABC transporter ATP-binding protein [Candidatus Bathyarchaeota archaeon]